MDGKIAVKLTGLNWCHGTPYLNGMAIMGWAMTLYITVIPAKSGIDEGYE